MAIARNATAAKLVLEDGTALAGRLAGAERAARGEVVFNTGMVGYTEALTDPSYRGQILVMTYPLVGNYGVPPAFESGKIQAAGLIVAELARDYSHAEAEKSLPQWLEEQGIPCLEGIDTRALAKRLRDEGWSTRPGDRHSVLRLERVACQAAPRGHQRSRIRHALQGRRRRGVTGEIDGQGMEHRRRGLLDDHRRGVTALATVVVGDADGDGVGA
jgi:hypothetical protein